MQGETSKDADQATRHCCACQAWSQATAAVTNRISFTSQHSLTPSVLSTAFLFIIFPLPCHTRSPARSPHPLGFSGLPLLKDPQQLDVGA